MISIMSENDSYDTAFLTIINFAEKWLIGTADRNFCCASFLLTNR